MKNAYVVYFRTGGTKNFKWRYVFSIFASVDSARAKKEELQRMGYRAHYARKAEMDVVGLPETFE